jgi:hypothetical protein
MSKVPKLVIDTCSWAKLIEEHWLLDSLEYWVETGAVELFTDRHIRQEWPKTRNKYVDEARRDAEENYVGYRRHLMNMGIPDHGKQLLELPIDNIIVRIDNLVQGSKELQSSQEADLCCVERDRLVPRRKPFVGNKASGMYDGYIIYTAIHYFQSIGEPFIFITENKSDFAFDKTGTTLHPDILEDFPDSQLMYYGFIGRAISQLKKSLPTPAVRSVNLNEKTLVHRESKSVVSLVAHSNEKSIIDPLYEYLTLRHKGIKFFPPRLLVNFAISACKRTYYMLRKRG